MLQGLAWSYSPSSKWCWSGRSRQSVGASFCFRPGVISFSWMAHFVRLYLHHIAVFSTYSPHVKALSSLTPCLHPTIITVRAALPGTFVSQRQSGHYAGLTIKLRHGSSDSSSNRHDMARPLIVRQKNRCAFGEECCGGRKRVHLVGSGGGSAFLQSCLEVPSASTAVMASSHLPTRLGNAMRSPDFCSKYPFTCSQRAKSLSNKPKQFRYTACPCRSFL